MYHNLVLLIVAVLFFHYSAVADSFPYPDPTTSSARSAESSLTLRRNIPRQQPQSRRNHIWFLRAKTTTTTTIEMQHNEKVTTSSRSSSIFLDRIQSMTTATALCSSINGGETTRTTMGDDNDYGANNIVQCRLLLLLVSVLYGTLNVSLRLVYALPDPPIASALSTTRGWLAAGCFLPPLWLAQQQKGAKNSSTMQQNEPLSSSSFVSLLLAGMELALWNFGAQGLINAGLLSTASARASFLTQTSVVLTPLLSVTFGQSVSGTVWIGSLIALLGLTVLSGGGAAAAAAAGEAAASTTLSGLFAFSTGDGLILGGALSWSFYLLRLSKLAPQFNDLNLQAIKTFILAILYSGWWLLSSTMTGSGGGTTAWMTNPIAWGLLFYSAVGPGTIADILQQKGQEQVSAAEANIILSMEPVFAAVCAFLFMGETTTFQEAVGGSLILISALIASQ